MIQLQLYISSKDWQKAPVQEKTQHEEIRVLTFIEKEFFFETENSKILIDFGIGNIQVPKKVFQKELNKFLSSKHYSK